MESSRACARPLHAPLHAVTHVKRPPDRATCTAAGTPLSAENGAREGPNGARADPVSAAHPLPGPMVPAEWAFHPLWGVRGEVGRGGGDRRPPLR